jgi:site-specific DNA-methyltransferase (adenine-specific)
MMEQFLNKVLHGDCIEIMKKLPSESIDAVITDPPYSSGTRREASKGIRKSMTRGRTSAEWFGSDSLTTNGFIYLMRQCALEWYRLLKPGGQILVFIDWRMYSALAGAIESADLRHNNLLVWDKTYFGMGSIFRNQHELILHFSKGKAEPQRRDTGNVLSFKPVRNSIHPTEKPADLIERLISVVCPEGGTVLDCFGGSGSTAVACKNINRNFILIERELPYVEYAISRIKNSDGDGNYENSSV